MRRHTAVAPFALFVLLCGWACQSQTEGRRAVVIEASSSVEAQPEPDGGRRQVNPPGQPNPMSIRITEGATNTDMGRREESLADRSTGDITPAGGDELAPTQLETLHFDNVVIDTHVDTTLSMTDDGFDIQLRHTSGHLDLPRMREGGLDAAFFSIWVDPGQYPGNLAFQRAIDLFTTVHQSTWSSDDVIVVDTSATLRLANDREQIAILFGVEGGHALGTTDEGTAIERLHHFRALGARYLSLTWSEDNAFAHSSTGEHSELGLTELGRALVVEMERIGMIVDVSHGSDQTVIDILDIATRPVMASHTATRALSEQPRNLSDDLIRRIGENGGIVCVDFFTQHLDSGYQTESNRVMRDNPEIFDRIRAEHLPFSEHGRATRAAVLELDPDLAVPDVETIANHIFHIYSISSPQTPCLGSDFDGVPELPAGLDDVTGLPSLTETLAERGLNDDDIALILGGNVLRVLHATE